MIAPQTENAHASKINRSDHGAVRSSMKSRKTKRTLNECYQGNRHRSVAVMVAEPGPMAQVP